MKSAKFLIGFALVVLSVISVNAQPPINRIGDEYVKKGKTEILIGERGGGGVILWVNETRDIGMIANEDGSKDLMFVPSRAKFWYSKKEEKDMIKEGCPVRFMIDKKYRMAILITIR